MTQYFFTALGFFLTFVLFYNIKVLKHDKLSKIPRLSIVIPARNEVLNLPTLLDGLQKQRQFIYEIIVANDGSTDETENIALSYNTTVINIIKHPEGWKGKTYACFKGANAATGDILLFIDADVIPNDNMISRLLSTYENGSVLSVQPYHYVERLYEQLSLFFNTIALAAVGVCFPGKDKCIGLFGPVLMVDRELYFSFGGHEVVKSEVIEDFVLGGLLRKRGIRCNSYMGYGSVSYQMYKEGIVSLIWGWSKNFAGAASGTPIRLLLPLVLWISAYYSTAIELIKNIIRFAYGEISSTMIVISIIVYLIFCLVLFTKTKYIGRFTLLTSVFYIVPLSAFTLIFIFSFVLKFIIRKVRWKGRWHSV